ncbi:MAG: hypothetical protein U0797_00610 [Gemmataceae bacterium]
MDRSAIGSRLGQALQVLERISTLDQPSSEQAAKELLCGLQGVFDAHAPATLFFANSLQPPASQKFVLLSHFHVGRFPPDLPAKWADHLVRGHSPILKQLRLNVRRLTVVGVAHACTRKAILSDARWFLSRICIRLATGLDISDQLLAWQHTESFVMAVILRGTKGRTFSKQDCEEVQAVVGAVRDSGVLARVFHPGQFPPRLTAQQEVVRDLVMLGYSDAEIARKTRVTNSAVEKAVAAVRDLYSARSRGDILLNFILRGGTPADINALVSRYGKPPVTGASNTLPSQI